MFLVRARLYFVLSVLGPVLGKSKPNSVRSAGVLRYGWSVCYAQIKETLRQYTVAAYKPDFETLTVTTFCMPEVMALVDADLFVAGIKWQRLQGSACVTRRNEQLSG
jgi:hypothetical protein